MLKSFQALVEALPYLENKEVRDAYRKVIRQLDRDADEVGFEPSTATEHAIADMTALINDIDEKKAKKTIDIPDDESE